MSFPDLSYKLDRRESVKAPRGLYNFLTDDTTRKSYVVPDAPYEELVLRFDNGETFSMKSCLRLTKGWSKEESSRESTRLKHFFNNTLNMNNLRRTPEQEKEAYEAAVLEAMDRDLKSLKKVAIEEVSPILKDFVRMDVVFPEDSEKVQKRLRLGGRNIRQILDQIAEQANWQWHIDYGKIIFRPKGVAPQKNADRKKEGNDS
jgi:hypothetical protein